MRNRVISTVGGKRISGPNVVISTRVPLEASQFSAYQLSQVGCPLLLGLEHHPHTQAHFFESLSQLADFVLAFHLNRLIPIAAGDRPGYVGEATDGAYHTARVEVRYKRSQQHDQQANHYNSEDGLRDRIGERGRRLKDVPHEMIAASAARCDSSCSIMIWTRFAL